MCLAVLSFLGFASAVWVTNRRPAATRRAAGPAAEATASTEARAAASAKAEGKQAEAGAVEAGATEASAPEAAIPATSLTALMKHDGWALPATATVGEAMHLLVSRGISGVPIVDDQSVVRGFISDGDIFRALGTHADSFATPYSFLVRRDDEEFDQTVADLIGRPALSIATRDVIAAATPPAPLPHRHGWR